MRKNRTQTLKTKKIYQYKNRPNRKEKKIPTTTTATDQRQKNNNNKENKRDGKVSLEKEKK